MIIDDDKNDPEPYNIPYQLSQKLNPLNCRSEVIIFPSQSKSVHHKYADFNIYSCEEVKNMKILIFVLFPVDYLKEVLISVKIL